MELSRRTVRALVVLLAISLAGLVVLQAILLDGARRQKDHAFDRAARTALAQMVRQLDTGEVLEHVAARFVSLDSCLTWGHAQVLHSEPGAEGRVVRVIQPDSLHVLPDSLFAAVFLDSGTISKSQLVRQVMLDLSGMASRPVTERLDRAAVDSLLPLALSAAGLDVAAQYGVAPAGGDSLVLASPGADRTALASSPYRARLFPTDILPPAYDLVAHFPARATWAWRRTAPLLVGSAVLTLLVVLCAVYAVRTILAQRRFATELVTFVDNLTHEFKTPLSTMALASEALARDDVRAEPDTLSRYSRMIGEEVARLREHVDRILQLAHLERGEMAVALEAVDAHETLEAVIEGIALQVSARGGTLTRSLEAHPSVVRADPVHLAGMVVNLLDNAVKYSRGAPDVELTTSLAGDRFVIAVRDRGIGVPARYRERVFDRYYRCQTGDRHDVKGFGLGLSYVRLMATLHGGSVELRPRDGGGAR